MRWLAIVACLIAPHIAHADDEIVRGAVVRIEAKEIYVSLGSDRGVADGAALRLKRSIKLVHPISHATISDWVPIGSAKVTQAGAVMSRAVVGELVTDIKVGDVAEVLVDRPDAAHPTPERPNAPKVDGQTADVLSELAAQSNQPLDVRIAGWEHYLSTHAGSPYAAAVRRDLDVLHELREQMKPPTSARTAETIATVAHAAPTSALAGSQLPLVFVLDQPERVASAYLHYRARNARTYRSVLLSREHDIYLRGQIPAEAMTAPGVDYFVEVSTHDGRSGLALATPGQPIAVDVASPPLLDRFGSTPGRSSVRLSADYLDFRTFDTRTGDRTDRMMMANIDFTYRLASVVETIGVGYGVYAGSGGNADAVYDMSSPVPKSGFQYGYADVEIGGHVDKLHVSTGGQVIAGVGRDGFGLGVEGRLRLGDRDATNLLFSARSIDQIGFISGVRFGTQPLARLGVGVSVAATNQPLRGNVGVVLGTELAIKVADSTSILLRGSWQGRSIAHGGIGGGAGLGFAF